MLDFRKSIFLLSCYLFLFLWSVIRDSLTLNTSGSYLIDGIFKLNGCEIYAFDIKINVCKRNIQEKLLRGYLLG